MTIWADLMHEENTDSLQNLRQRLRRFAEERDWDQFHSPKNLSMALIAEAAELVEHFQWLTAEQSTHLNKDRLEQIELEVADVLIFLIRLADKLDLDLIEAAYKKIEINEQRYPAHQVRGQHKKYTEY